VQAPRFAASNAQTGSFGYLDVEISPATPPIGSSYFNVTLNQPKLWNGTTWQTGGGGSATPGGTSTNVQFNDSGVLGGNGNFTFDKNTGIVNIDGALGSTAVTIGPHAPPASSWTLDTYSPNSTFGSIVPGASVTGTGNTQVAQFPGNVASGTSAHTTIGSSGVTFPDGTTQASAVLGGAYVPSAGGAWTVPGALDPTGVADNSTAINGYISALVSSYFGSGASLALPPGKFYVPSLSNVYGVSTVGSGVLLKQVNQNNGTTTATKALAQTYACAPPRLICGQEYESHWLYNIENSLTTAAIFAGDSTTASGNNVSGSYTVDQLFLTSAKQAGITVLTVTNNGHSGKNTADWLASYLATDQALNPDIYFIRYGINDPAISGSPLSTITNIRTGLACIRNGCAGVSAKTVDQQTIVLEMPSSVNDNPNGRGPLYYEQLRNAFVQAAHDYPAVFVDNYGYMQDNDYAVQTCMMDLPYVATPQTPPIHIHPGSCKAVLYNTLLVQALIDPVKVVTGGGTTILPSNVMESCGTATFTSSTTSAALPCAWVTTGSSCTGTWIGTNVAGGAIGILPSSGSVTLTATNSNSNTASVACSITASAGPVTIADNFAGTVGTTLASHVTNYGQSWVKAWTSAWSGTISLTGSNSGTMTGGSVLGAGYYVNVIPSSWDYTVSGSCSLSTAGDQCSMIGRASTGVLTFYQASFLNGTGVGLYKYVNGTSTQLGSTYSGVTSGTHTIALRMVGTQISVLVDGTQQIGPITDSAVTTGYAGLELATASSHSTVASYSMQ
jgi:hypothetical protein